MANLNQPDRQEHVYLDDLQVGQRFISGTHLSAGGDHRLVSWLQARRQDVTHDLRCDERVNGQHLGTAKVRVSQGRRLEQGKDPAERVMRGDAMR
jgi:hypothetical protein